MATNFFEQQDVARKNTRWLIFLFVLAVLSLITLTNLFLFLFPWEWRAIAFTESGANRDFVCLMDERCSIWQQIDWMQVVVVSSFITGVIALVCLFKWLQIRKGGRAIAKMMGGTLVQADSKDFKEQRLLNVVEEMALASNMPVPAVYVLKEEQGINAFAAGFSSRDAVVAVTQGALDNFSRDQLQGVVAHEFSHILNGDMRLNMKLIAVLFGIMFITEMGWIFIRGSRLGSRKRNEGPILFLGLGLIILGYLGTFFGNLIKAAVSRQREFLADASAVQFTRNPSGIADALKVIGGSYGGSQISNEHGSEISHLFFGEGLSRVAAIFATHPPLVDRIKRIQPNWDGYFLKPEVAQRAANQISQDDIKDNQQQAKRFAAVAVAASMTMDEMVEPRAMMMQKLSEPLTAASILLCLLYDKNDEQQQKHIASLANKWPELHKNFQENAWMNWQRQDFLPVVNRAVSGLRSLSNEQYQELKRFMLLLIQSNGKIELYEWALFQLVRSSLDSYFSDKTFERQKYRRMEAIEKDVKLVVAMMIQSSSADEAMRLEAWRKACQVAGIEAETDLPTVAIADFGRSVNRLALAFPLLKPRIIKALIEAAKADGIIEDIEKQSIMAISAAIDAPLPDVLLEQLEIQNE